MATPLDPLKFRIAYLNLPTRKTIASNAKIVSISNCFNILYRTKMCAILAYFCPNLVAIATPFAPLKILAYLIHRSRRLDYINEEALSILYIMKFVCLILPKFSSRGNFLASLKILHSTFEFTNPVKPTIHAQNLSISCTEQNWNLCNFGLLLPKFGCHGNSLGSLENSDNIFEFTNPADPTIHPKNSSSSCTELKFVQFWLIFV